MLLLPGQNKFPITDWASPHGEIINARITMQNADELKDKEEWTEDKAELMIIKIW
jgi:hypothetical protein